jgi:hypothetical protein
MAKQSISTLKNWFRSLLKPTQQQFWDWMDSFWHKDENIPANKVENLQSLLDAKINVAEKGAPNGLPVLDGQGKIITDYIPALAITDLHIALQPTLFDFCQYEWEFVSIQKGDLVQITRADEVVEMYQLYTGSGSSPSQYKMINVSKIDWSNVINKPPLANPANVLALNQGQKQTMTRFPIVADLTPGSLLIVDADKSVRVLTGLVWDDVNKDLGIGVQNPEDSLVVGPQNASGSDNRIASMVANSNDVRVFQVENASVGSSSEIRINLRSGSALFYLIVPNPNRTGTFLGTNRAINNYIFSQLRAMTMATSGNNPITFSTNSIARGVVTGTGLWGFGHLTPTKLVHINGLAGYLSAANMGSGPEDFASKFYVDSLVQAAIKLQADWDANTNTPDITGVTTTGYAFRVIVPGNTNLGGITNWLYGELAVKIDTGWMRIGAGSFNLNWGSILGSIANQTDLIELVSSVSAAAVDAYKDATFNMVVVDSQSTLSPTGDRRENILLVTALATSASVEAPSGTPEDAGTLMIRIKDNGTARALTFNAAYSGFAEALPTTTIAGKTMYIGFIYNATSEKWELMSIINQT